MKADSVAPIRVPGRCGEKTWHPTLLDRIGRREAVAFVWRGDVACDDRTLYVAFSPLRYRSQFVKVIAGGVVDKRRTADRRNRHGHGHADVAGLRGQGPCVSFLSPVASSSLSPLCVRVLVFVILRILWADTQPSCEDMREFLCI
ncbi:unnamed protein product [Prorocentrum cordatum]|uniref:Uncharacterized protein n=1 Tax=Prorocentrum cordatum TaxID=2364126 RepID=A0ABN9RXQ7_9DINO|nr:unnamed protein product [Polarella glacialis]